MSRVDEISQTNAAHVAKFGDEGVLPVPLGRRFAILTCMDARRGPATYAGLAKRDVHVIRFVSVDPTHV